MSGSCRTGILQVDKNGCLCFKGFSSQITIVDAPPEDVPIIIPGGQPIPLNEVLGNIDAVLQTVAAGSTLNVVDSFIPTLAQTIFGLTETPIGGQKVIVDLNGQIQREGSTYTLLGTVLTWLDKDFILETTDNLNIYYVKIN